MFQGSLIGTDNWDLAGFMGSTLQSFINSVAVSLTGKRVKNLINNVVRLNNAIVVCVTIFSGQTFLFDIDTFGHKKSLFT